MRRCGRSTTATRPPSPPGSRLLVEAAGKLGPKDLGVVAARVVDAIDPDGVSPADEREHQERRFFHLKHRGDGIVGG